MAQTKYQCHPVKARVLRRAYRLMTRSLRSPGLVARVKRFSNVCRGDPDTKHKLEQCRARVEESGGCGAARAEETAGAAGTETCSTTPFHRVLQRKSKTSAMLPESAGRGLWRGVGAFICRGHKRSARAASLD